MNLTTEVILVNENDEAIGSMEKMEAHRQGLLHRAFSIFIFNKKGEKLASVGALGYGDYPTFKNLYGKEYADERRKLYKERHESDRHVRGSAGYYADKLLW